MCGIPAEPVEVIRRTSTEARHLQIYRISSKRLVEFLLILHRENGIVALRLLSEMSSG